MGRLLEERGIIRSRYAFDVVRMVKHGTLKAGEYRFDHPASVFTVYDRLRRGDVYYRVVTVPEVPSGADIVRVNELSSSPRCQRETITPDGVGMVTVQCA